MSYKVQFTDQYLKRAEKFLRKHPDVKGQYYKTIEFLELDPFHPSLRLHKLSGRLDGLHSVSINMAYRITLEFLIQDGRVIPVDVGSHEQVY